MLEPAAKAESLAYSDPRAACFYSRRALEMAVACLYKHDAALRLPYQDNLNALLHEPTFRNTAGEEIFLKAKIIKDLGDHAVHSKRPIFDQDSQECQRQCWRLGKRLNTRIIATNSFSVLFDSLAPAHGCRVEIFKRARLKQRAVPRITHLI